MKQLVAVSAELPLVFAVHPRTRKKLEEFGLTGLLQGPGITLTEPLGYIQFMNLVRTARAVITDSGGVQEESTYLGIPCLTLAREHRAADYGQRGFQPARQTSRPLRTRAGGSRWALAHRAPSGALGRPDGRALRSGAQAAHWDLIKRR